MTYLGEPIVCGDRAPALAIVGVLEHILGNVLVGGEPAAGGNATHFSPLVQLNGQVLVVGALPSRPCRCSFTVMLVSAIDTSQT